MMQIKSSIYLTLSSGTVEKSVNVPCGISIETKKVSLCQSVRDSLGNTGSNFINKAGAMCNCIPKVLSLIKAGIYHTLFSASGSLDVDSSLVTEMIQLQNVSLFFVMYNVIYD